MALTSVKSIFRLVTRLYIDDIDIINVTPKAHLLACNKNINNAFA